VLSVTSSGQVVRSPINEELRPKGRSTMGVTFVKLKAGDTVSVVARSVERASEIDEAVAEAEADSDAGPEADEQDSATIEVDGSPVPSSDETDADSETEES
jgi:DNA gyrase subunit A